MFERDSRLLSKAPEDHPQTANRRPPPPPKKVATPSHMLENVPPFHVPPLQRPSFTSICLKTCLLPLYTIYLNSQLSGTPYALMLILLCSVLFAMISQMSALLSLWYIYERPIAQNRHDAHGLIVYLCISYNLSYYFILYAAMRMDPIRRQLYVIIVW